MVAEIEIVCIGNELLIGRKYERQLDWKKVYIFRSKSEQNNSGF